MKTQWTDKYELLQADTVVGIVTYDLAVPTDTFHGWLGGRFEPSPAFVAVEPQFREMNRLNEIEDDDLTEEDDRAWQRSFEWVMSAGFRVRSLDDGSVEALRGLIIEPDGRIQWRPAG